ncbi:hypothetical protein T484DRAFT_1823470 [Baffinella frigidus]|nr:hypothetical protein T484DRAFT_1823470 [Cryptophyta sp. CCMP2293]
MQTDKILFKIICQNAIEDAAANLRAGGSSSTRHPFKIICQNAIEDAAANPRAGGDGAAAAGATVGFDPEGEGGEGVGALEDQGGFSLGKAPDGAKPAVSVRVGEPSPGKMAGPGQVLSSPVKKAVGAVGDGGFDSMPSKQQAFEEYREDGGAAQNKILKENANSLKEKKQLQKVKAAEINRVKREIDDLRQDLGVRRGGVNATADKTGDVVVNATADKTGDVVVDAEEFAVVRTLKQKKQQYREAHELFLLLRTEVDYLTKRTEQARATFVLDFEQWYKVSYEGAVQDNTTINDTSMGPLLPSQVDEDGEVMDDGEKFDQLEVARVMAEDPESLAFHNASKNVFRKTAVGGKGNTKRVKGEANPQPVV